VVVAADADPVCTPTAAAQARVNADASDTILSLLLLRMGVLLTRCSLAVDRLVPCRTR
jgi:hypothetical protein